MKKVVNVVNTQHEDGGQLKKVVSTMKVHVDVHVHVGKVHMVVRIKTFSACETGDGLPVVNILFSLNVYHCPVEHFIFFNSFTEFLHFPY